jgi:hypothetical protein
MCPSRADFIAALTLPGDDPVPGAAFLSTDVYRDNYASWIRHKSCSTLSGLIPLQLFKAKYGSLYYQSFQRSWPVIIW